VRAAPAATVKKGAAPSTKHLAGAEHLAPAATVKQSSSHCETEQQPAASRGSIQDMHVCTRSAVPQALTTDTNSMVNNSLNCTTPVAGASHTNILLYQTAVLQALTIDTNQQQFELYATSSCSQLQRYIAELNCCVLQALTGRQGMATACPCSRLPMHQACSNLKMQPQQPCRRTPATAAAAAA
jgi:hypothetical protein